jgi:hypothetical protein
MTIVPEVRERVQRLLADWHGEPANGANGELVVDVAEARVAVRVEQDGELVSVVLVSTARSGMDCSDALLRYVATQNYRFGSLRVVEEPSGLATVVFQYSLLGATLDPDELRHAVESVATATSDIRSDLERLAGLAPTGQPGVAAPDRAAREPVVGPLPPPAVPTGVTWFQGSIEVVLPAGWYAKESFTILAPDGQANVILSSEPLDEAIDVQRYADVQGDLLEKEFPHFRGVGVGEMVLSGGISGRWRQFGWTPPDGLRVTQLQIYAVPFPGRGYTATATSPDGSWDRYAELLRSIVFHASLRPRAR